ncbi:cell cycle control protein 50B-like [Pelobates fuscus]|uniref:cell cycle control protein 50B-like n=1 Tax=Pelobates fuscus TaxID=191477 RepID=UPI002FE48385
MATGDFRSIKEPVTSQRPDNTAFTQQRLPAWQPLLSASIVLPFFLLAGLSFIAIGSGLLYSSKSITEREFDYTGVQPGDRCSDCFNVTYNATVPCPCNFTFNLTDTFQGPVFMYYELSNFFQNHYRYMISRDDKQLSGYINSIQSPANDCYPYQYDKSNVPYAPCGAIANSMFNDVFKLYYNDNGSYSEVPLTKTGIAWWTDYNIKFRNPIQGNESLSAIFNGTAKLPNWAVPVYRLSDGFTNEDFIVWMRSAALPNFRKLYSRIEEGNYTTGLPPGHYMFQIDYKYPVLSFGGRKKIVFSSVSWMGGKNPFLGIAYIVFGSLSFFCGILMLIVCIKYQDKTNDDI